MSSSVSKIVGSPVWFFFSVIMVIIWFFSGFFVGFGEMWHLAINSTTTILTFLMMSLLHASQSKWESKMERLQSKEKSALKQIEQKTEQIVGEVVSTVSNPNTPEETTTIATK